MLPAPSVLKTRTFSSSTATGMAASSSSRSGSVDRPLTPDELAAVCRAVDEAISIGRQAGCRVEISHLRATGRGSWSKRLGALDLIESARRAAVQVLADAYPYTAYSTGLTILLPEAVRKMTSMPADQIGLADRGSIAVGKKAALVLFSASTVKDQATFDHPHRYASGIGWPRRTRW